MAATTLAAAAFGACALTAHADTSPTPPPYTMQYGAGSCDLDPSQAICKPLTPTMENPKPWITLLPAPTKPAPRVQHDGPVTSSPAPTVYTSLDGLTWTLRQGRPQ